MLRCPVSSRRALAALRSAAVTDREVSRALVALTRRGLAESSVRRFRDSLSAFFAWAVRERMIVANPVLADAGAQVARHANRDVPASRGASWRRSTRDAVGRDQRLADLLLIDAWTGLRWSELRAIRVRDFIEVPLPVLVVQRAAPEGVRVKVTKSGKSRRVPVADRVLPLVQALDGRPGRRRSALRHRVRSPAARVGVQADARVDERLRVGRRIHDLRHTAACLWLARGVDPVTVQAWMGHASIATTNLYLHYLGTSADRAGLARLNDRGHAGGRQRADLAE